MLPSLPSHRPRRLRASAAIRDLTREHRLHPHDFIAPMFVMEGGGDSESIDSMPGIFRHSLAGLAEHARVLRDLGVRGIAVFPRIDAGLKDEMGGHFRDPDNLMLRAVRALKRGVPELAVFSDVALDPYTSHGHDGLLNAAGTDVDNDRTVIALCEMARMQADAGADFVAPSDMMDGRVRAIRETLDAAGHADTGILAYAAKFNSAFYGPFRDAVGSKCPAGYLDKSGYQLDPANAREALLEAALDEEEGADILMVKPAGPYLDLVRQLRDRTLLPLAVYQVSGEYAMLQAAAERGWLDARAAAMEQLLGFKRAGADIILTYWAEQAARWLR